MEEKEEEKPPPPDTTEQEKEEEPPPPDTTEQVETLNTMLQQVETTCRVVFASVSFAWRLLHEKGGSRAAYKAFIEKAGGEFATQRMVNTFSALSYRMFRIWAGMKDSAWCKDITRDAIREDPRGWVNKLGSRLSSLGLINSRMSFAQLDKALPLPQELKRAQATKKGGLKRAIEEGVKIGARQNKRRPTVKKTTATQETKAQTEEEDRTESEKNIEEAEEVLEMEEMDQKVPSHESEEEEEKTFDDSETLVFNSSLYPLFPEISGYDQSVDQHLLSKVPIEEKEALEFTKVDVDALRANPLFFVWELQEDNASSPSDIGTAQWLVVLVTLYAHRIRERCKPIWINGFDVYLNSPNWCTMVVEKTTSQFVMIAIPPHIKDLSPSLMALDGVLAFARQINEDPGLQKGQNIMKGTLGQVDVPLFVHENKTEILNAAQKLKCSISAVLVVAANGGGIYIRTGVNDEKKMVHMKNYRFNYKRQYLGGTRSGETIGGMRRALQGILSITKGLTETHLYLIRQALSKALKILADRIPVMASYFKWLDHWLEQNPFREAVVPLLHLLYAFAYAFNLSDVRNVLETAIHVDPNCPATLSIATFAGSGYRGGDYFLPQFRIAFPALPGWTIIHMSSRRYMGIGYHSNLGIEFIHPDGQKVTVIHYLHPFWAPDFVLHPVERILHIDHHSLEKGYGILVSRQHTTRLFWCAVSDILRTGGKWEHNIQSILSTAEDQFISFLQAMVLHWQKIEKETESCNKKGKENKEKKLEEEAEEQEEMDEGKKQRTEKGKEKVIAKKQTMRKGKKKGKAKEQEKEKEKEKEATSEEIYPLEWLLDRVTGVELYPVLRSEDPLWTSRQLLVENTFKSTEVELPGTPFQQIFLSLAFRLCGRPSFFIEHFDCRLPFPNAPEELKLLEKEMRDALSKKEKVFTGRYQHPSVEDYIWVLTRFVEQKSDPWKDTWEHFDTFSIKMIFDALIDIRFIDHFFAWQIIADLAQLRPEWWIEKWQGPKLFCTLGCGAQKGFNEIWKISKENKVSSIIPNFIARVRDQAQKGIIHLSLHAFSFIDLEQALCEYYKFTKALKVQYGQAKIEK